MHGSEQKRKSRKPSSPRKLKRLDPLLAEIGRTGDRLGLRAYLVGGAVRDLLLGLPHFDRDIVVEGDPAPLVRELARRLGAGVVSHRRFGTFVLTFDGCHLDVVTARREAYPVPGSLPVVEFSDLRDDLFRRDFTINAIAVSLSREGFGALVDFYGGLRDLRGKKLRVLHDASFRDDPTRIYRLARFAARFARRGFRVERNTGRLVFRDHGHVLDVSDERRREEILAILAEPEAYRALRLLDRWGILALTLPGVRVTPALRKIGSLPGSADKIRLLLGTAPEAGRQALMERLKLPRVLKKEIIRLDRPGQLPPLTGRDLIKLGYRPGPEFKNILEALAAARPATRREAVRFLFDKFPKKS